MSNRRMTSACLALGLVALATACTGQEGALEAPAMDVPDADGTTEAVIARGEALDLGGEWVLPPNDPAVNHTAGFAKILCSNVFLTGLDPAFAAEHTGGFSSPFDTRSVVTDTVVDAATQSVRLTLPDGTVRSAKRYGSQGCVASALGEDSVRFTPSTITANVPDPATTPWPMGDVTSTDPWPSELDMDKVEAAVDAAFDGEGLTAAFVVTYKGRIIGERYRDGIDMHTPLESWSKGKSLSATLLGTLIHQGVYDLWQSAPIPEWQTGGDPRQEIRIADILRMSSGLRFRAPQDPDFDPDVGYPDHLYVYTGPNAFAWAASKQQQWKPGTVGRYRNSDPVLTNYMIRLGVEGRGEDYHSYPQRGLFDKLGISHFTPETDPEGNFLLQGYEFASARDWARLGNLYLQDGVWNGERLLPEGFADFVSSLAPRLGRRWPQHLWRPVLDQRRRRDADSGRCLLHGRCRRTVHDHDSEPRPGGGSARTLLGFRSRWRSARQRAGTPDGGGSRGEPGVAVPVDALHRRGLIRSARVRSVAAHPARRGLTLPRQGLSAGSSNPFRVRSGSAAR